MVSRLTLNFISFFQPLFTKSARFFGLADRAISLFLIRSVNLIEKMTVLAFCFPFIYRTNRIRIFNGIFPSCNNPKMFRIDAISISTSVANNHTTRNIPFAEKISNSMRSSMLLYKIKRTIAILIQSVSPNMTVTNLLPIIIETNNPFLISSIHIEHYMPFNKKYKYV